LPNIWQVKGSTSQKHLRQHG